MPEVQGLMTTKQVAAQLDVTQGWVRMLCIKGELEAEKLGRSWAITPAALERYKMARKFGGSNTK